MRLNNLRTNWISLVTLIQKCLRIRAWFKEMIKWPVESVGIGMKKVGGVETRVDFKTLTMKIVSRVTASWASMTSLPRLSPIYWTNRPINKTNKITTKHRTISDTIKITTKKSCSRLTEYLLLVREKKHFLQLIPINPDRSSSIPVAYFRTKHPWLPSSRNKTSPSYRWPICPASLRCSTKMIR